MRLFISVLATAAMIFAASAASAVTFSVIGTSTSLGSELSALLPGEEVTIDIRVGADADGVFGMGASVWGYDENVADFVSGDAVASIFNAVAIPGVGAFSGLSNLNAGALGESFIGANGNRVQIFNGAGLSPTFAQALDPGLDGNVGGGDAMFRVTFAAIAPGTTSLNIGTGYQGDVVVLAGGVTIQAQNGVVELTVVPEPGTALLMGLGLAGLAAAGRRE